MTLETILPVLALYVICTYVGIFLFAHLHLQRTWTRLFTVMAWCTMIGFPTLFLKALLLDLRWLPHALNEPPPETPVAVQYINVALVASWTAAALVGYGELARRACVQKSLSDAWNFPYPELL
jgi:hypothetical protein